MSKQLGVLTVLAIFVCSMSLVGCPSKSIVNLDNYPEISLDKIGDSIVSFFKTGKITPIEVGDIIVGTSGGGFLRRVLSVNDNDSKLETSTEFVSLAEAVQDGELNAVVNFEPETFVKGGARLAKADSLTIDLSGLTVLNAQGVTLTIVSGSLTYAPTTTLNVKFEGGKVTALSTMTEGDFTINADLRLQVSKPISLSYEYPLYTFVQPWVFYIGPVPVAGTVNLAFPIGIVGTLNSAGAVEDTFTQTTHVKIGGQMVDGKWVDATAFDAGPVACGTPKFTFTAAAGVDVYVKAIATLDLYGCSNLTGTFKPYFEFDSWLYPAPQTLVIGFGLDASINYNFSLLGITLFNKTWDVLGKNTNPPTWWEIYRNSWN